MAITTQVKGRVLHIGLDRAAKRNAFNLEMLSKLSEAYAELENNAELWCALVFAHGEHFTAGLDLKEVAPQVMKGGDLFPKDGIDPLDLFGPRRSKPVVCAVQGYCFTIGIELLLASDIRLAATDTRFRQMEVNRGIMPFGGATLRLPQVAGWGNAMRYLLTGDEFSAEDAHRMGIVQELAAPDELYQRASALAERVAACAPLAVQASRRSSRISVEEGPEAAKAEFMSETRRLMASEDAAEGLKAFMERRDGEFSGR